MTTHSLEHTSTDHEDLHEMVQRVRGQAWGVYAALPECVPQVSSPRHATIRFRTKQLSVQDQTELDDVQTSSIANALLLGFVESSDASISKAVRDSILSLQKVNTTFARLTGAKNELFRESLQAFTNAFEIVTVKSGLRRLLNHTSDSEWTDEKNERRCELIDKDIEGTILPFERRELDELQQQMLAYRRKKAPLPLKEVQRFHQELLRKAAKQDE